MRITAETMKAARMRRDYHVDGTGFCEEAYTCIQHPALCKIVRFPRGRGKVPKGVDIGTFHFVDGGPVEGTMDAIAAALTEHYNTTSSRPVLDFDAEMDEAGEP